MVHIIARFVNGAFRLAGPTERAAYLTRMRAALAHTDWHIVAYALMSSHVHLAAVAGHDALERFAKSLHVGFARWLNHAAGTFGPVFAERPTTIHLPSTRLPRLVAYIHNNPVRAKVVGDALESSWTSHRCWLGHEPPPSWLSVRMGIEMSGFGDSGAGRRRFGDFVVAHAGEPRDPELSGACFAERRTLVRDACALPVELGSPAAIDDGDGAWSHPVRHHGLPAALPRWPGELRLVLDRVAQETGVLAPVILSRSHLRPVVRARRLVVVAGVVFLRRRVGEVAAALAISDAAVSRHLRCAAPEVVGEAERIAAQVRGGGVVAPAVLA